VAIGEAISGLTALVALHEGNERRSTPAEGPLFILTAQPPPRLSGLKNNRFNAFCQQKPQSCGKYLNQFIQGPKSRAVKLRERMDGACRLLATYPPRMMLQGGSESLPLVSENCA